MVKLHCPPAEVVVSMQPLLAWFRTSCRAYMRSLAPRSRILACTEPYALGVFQAQGTELHADTDAQLDHEKHRRQGSRHIPFWDLRAS